MFLSFKAMVCNPAAERKMFEAERNSGIQKFEEISFGSLLSRNIFCSYPQTAPSLEMTAVLVNVVGKEQYRSICRYTILKQHPFERISPSAHTMQFQEYVHRQYLDGCNYESNSHQGLLTSHHQPPVVPTHTSVAGGRGYVHRTYLWHDLRCAFDFVIRTAMKRMRTLTPYPSVKVHSYNLVARTLRHINIRHSHI